MALVAEWSLVYGMFMVDINVDMNYIYHSDLVYKLSYTFIMNSEWPLVNQETLMVKNIPFCTIPLDSGDSRPGNDSQFAMV